MGIIGNLEYYTKESYFEEYIQGEDFQRRRNAHKSKHPNSYYCYICDCRRILNWHHIRYDTLGREDFFNDGWWLCDPRCPCKGNCHFKAHKSNNGVRIPLEVKSLRVRRQQLRKQYILEHFRPSTVVYFLKTFFYRLMW